MMDIDKSIQIERATCARIPTDVGQFQLCLYTSNHDNKEHLAVVMGDVRGQEKVLVRVHSECFTGDVLGSRRCDCGEQLQRALERIATEGQGILLYLRQEGRGIGLAQKLRAYNLQDDGFDTVDANLALGHEADERDYTIGALILKDLGVTSIRLITNNPVKIERLTELGIQVVDRLPSVPTQLTADSYAYLETKVARMRHLLNLQGLSDPAAASTPLELLTTRPPLDRPLVTLTYAQSLDGAIASQRGRPTSISGRETMELTHQLRAAHDGILVGIETVLSDNPRLNVRLAKGDNPTPVILDSRLRTPTNARLFDVHERPIIVTQADHARPNRQALESRGAQVVPVNCDDHGRPSLPLALRSLYQVGIRRLMVEGGAKVIQSFLRHRLADQAIVTVALRFMGGYHVMNGAQPVIAFDRPRQMQLGDDLVLWGRLKGAPN
ncbi:MAG: GTP cyclohydrolase II [Ardenticatenaceae bacterium]|nr:GTP cyclohydrolase II [Ardenticatenaceae bacterium]